MSLKALLVFLDVNLVKSQNGWGILGKVILKQEAMAGLEHKCTRQKMLCPEEP